MGYLLLCTHKLLGESKKLHSFLFTNKLFPLFIPHALKSLNGLQSFSTNSFQNREFHILSLLAYSAILNGLLTANTERTGDFLLLLVLIYRTMSKLAHERMKGNKPKGMQVVPVSCAGRESAASF
jgi:hypothetical protein